MTLVIFLGVIDKTNLVQQLDGLVHIESKHAMSGVFGLAGRPR
jgi:hypothetical protein